MSSAAGRGDSMAAMDPADKWLLMQTLGDKPQGMLVDGDVVSAVEFDHKGNFLATGDRGGRVRIYEKCDVELEDAPPNARRTVGAGAAPAGATGPGVEYRLWHEFVSHEVCYLCILLRHPFRSVPLRRQESAKEPSAL